MNQEQKQALIDAGWTPPREHFNPNFAQSIHKLTDSAYGETRGVQHKECKVEKKDLQELLFHFNRIDDELRQFHYNTQSKIHKSTIAFETIRTLEEPALKSPRIYSIKQAVQNCKNTFDIIRILTSAVLHLDEDLSRISYQLANKEAHSRNPRPISMSEEEYQKNFIRKLKDL